MSYTGCGEEQPCHIGHEADMDETRAPESQRPFLPRAREPKEDHNHTTHLEKSPSSTSHRRPQKWARRLHWQLARPEQTEPWAKRTEDPTHPGRGNPVPRNPIIAWCPGPGPSRLGTLCMHSPTHNLATHQPWPKTPRSPSPQAHPGPTKEPHSYQA